MSQATAYTAAIPARSQKKNRESKRPPSTIAATQATNATTENTVSPTPVATRLIAMSER